MGGSEAVQQLSRPKAAGLTTAGRNFRNPRLAVGFA